MNAEGGMKKETDFPAQKFIHFCEECLLFFGRVCFLTKLLPNTFATRALSALIYHVIFICQAKNSISKKFFIA
jgi:hypothetical protein